MGHVKIWAANTVTLLGSEYLLSKLLIHIDKYTCKSSPGLNMEKYLVFDNVLGYRSPTDKAGKKKKKRYWV